MYVSFGSMRSGSYPIWYGIGILIALGIGIMMAVSSGKPSGGNVQIKS